MECRDAGADYYAIAAVLAQAEIDEAHIIDLIDEARSNLEQTRLRRGFGRIALGVVVGAGGVGASIGLSGLFPGWVALWGLVVVGLIQIARGVQILSDVEPRTRS